MLKFLVQCKFLFARVQWSLAPDTSYSLEFINPNDWMSYKLWHLRNQCDICFLFFFFFLGLPCKFLQGICFHTVMPQFDWLYDVCGCVMSPTSSIYWVELGFINNCNESQLWLVLLRYSADVASAFPWVVTYGIRAGPVIPCGFRDTTPQSGP